MVYYDDNGYPTSYSAVIPEGVTFLLLKEDLRSFACALSKPVLVLEDNTFVAFESAEANCFEPDTKNIPRPSTESLFLALESATVRFLPEDDLGPVPETQAPLEVSERSGKSPVFKSFPPPRALLVKTLEKVGKPCPFCQGRVLPRDEWNTGIWCCDTLWRLRCDQAGR